MNRSGDVAVLNSMTSGFVGQLLAAMWCLYVRRELQEGSSFRGRLISRTRDGDHLMSGWIS